MSNKKLGIWLGVLVAAFLIGWLTYKTIPFKTVEPGSSQESFRVDTASWVGFRRVADHLDLKDGQRALFHERERAYRDSLYYYRQRLSEVDAQIIQALSAAEPDRDLLKSYTRESGQLQEAIKRLTIDHFLGLRALCTPEQQEKLTGMFFQMHQGYGQRQRGQGKGHGMQHGRRNRPIQ